MRLRGSRGSAAVPLLAALLLAACGSTADPQDAAVTREETGPSDAGTPGDHDPSGGSGGGSKEDGSKGDARGDKDKSGGSGASTDDGDGGDASVGGNSQGSRSGRGSGSSPASAGGVASPAAGTYVYRQQGFEEFCSTTCDRDRLPPRQRIEAIQRSRTAASRVVVTEARASGDRLVRTTTRYTDAAAHVTEVHLEYSYEGFNFSRTYRPKPPVASLRFPLRTGDGWSGTWKGDVSGSYSVHVDGRDAVGGVNVAKLDTSMRFRGDLRGRANVTVWVDPRDGTVMRTAGNMTVEMGFGTYRSGFETSLGSRP
jgi:hypothetical protein